MISVGPCSSLEDVTSDVIVSTEVLFVGLFGLL